jgi:hypothetical protein
MRTVLKFEPRFTTRSAFEDFLAAGRGSPPVVMPALAGAVGGAERVVLDSVDRLRPAS